MEANPFYKKIKGSLPTTIHCNYCKNPIAHYQKVGKGNLLRMHVSRIVESNFSLNSLPKRLHCPYCKEHLGSLITDKRKQKMAYRMVRSSVSMEWNY